MISRWLCMGGYSGVSESLLVVILGFDRACTEPDEVLSLTVYCVCCIMSR